MKLGATLADLAGQLRAVGAGFAVVGGLAASARGEARFTRDLGDIQAILGAQPDLDGALVLRLLNTIAERGFARGQDLVEKWAQIRSRLGDGA